MCNCPSCISIAHAVTRRAITITSRPRVRLGNTFGLFSSSLAASAALADSSRKDNRRKQWDKVIEEAKAEIKAQDLDHEERCAALLDILSENGANATEETLLSDTEESLGEILLSGRGKNGHLLLRKVLDPYGPRESLADAPTGEKTDTWRKILDWAVEEDQRRAASGFQDWKGLPMDLLQKLTAEQLGQLLTDHRLLRQFYGGAGEFMADETRYLFWGPKKMKTLEWSIAKMVYRLLLQCSENPLSYLDGPLAPLLVELEEIRTTQAWSPRKQPEDTDTVAEKAIGPCESGCDTAKVEPQAAPNPEYPASRLEANLYHRLTIANDRLTGLHRTTTQNEEYYLNYESPGLPRYVHNSFNAYEMNKTFNSSLDALLQEFEREKDMIPAMTKVCYHLLKSDSPPTIETYNMLLLRFCELENTQLVIVVLKSIRESHTRANEITHATLLRFFDQNGLSFAFREYLTRMEGYHGGLSLLKPSPHLKPIVSSSIYRFGNGDSKIARKARMNSEVYMTLIPGALRWLNERFAMHYYQKMIREGWQPTTELLVAILRHCCYRSEWSDGLAVWHKIKRLWGQQIGHQVSTLAYQWMLCLCQVCKEFQRYDEVLEDGVEQGALPCSMLQVPHHVKTQNVAAMLEYAEQIKPFNLDDIMPKATRSVVRKLFADTSNYSLENAIQSCSDEAAVSEMVARILHEGTRLRSELKTIQTGLWYISKKMLVTAKQVQKLLSQDSPDVLKLRLSARMKLLNQKTENSIRGPDRAASLDKMQFDEYVALAQRNDDSVEGLDAFIDKAPSSPESTPSKVRRDAYLWKRRRQHMFLRHQINPRRRKQQDLKACYHLRRAIKRDYVFTHPSTFAHVPATHRTKSVRT